MCFKSKGGISLQKRLTKSDDRVLFGVLGGVAEYFGWDKAWTRIGGAFLILFTNIAGLLLYLVAAIVMPDKNRHDDTPAGEFHHR